MKAFILASALVLSSSVAFAHPGQTDRNGCHFSERQGYHCHR